MNRLKFFLLFALCSLLFALFTLYSYTQVDLNLTLSSNPAYQSIQRQLTQIGYFNRPLSTVIFFTILALLITNYGLLITRYKQWQLTAKQLWILLFALCSLLFVSYPAFAHDIFNYMFDTRTIIKYGQNPYITTPLDFPQDEWTRFMRWTHVGSAYPPGWLITTIPFYLLGLGKFTLTLLSFKILGLVSFLASSWSMLKIAGRKAWILWSFNPMVLIESLSSVHNEITMVAFTLLGFYLSSRAKRSGAEGSSEAIKIGRLRRPRFPRLQAPGAPATGGQVDFARNDIGILFLIWGGLIKYTSILLVPFLRKPLFAAVAAWAGAVAFFFIREINPWYILLPVTISFMSKNKYLTSLSLISSLIVMYRYYPCVAIFSC